ncbi:cytidylate kinase [Lachnospiraceae bacterium oral taxon 500]|nr:cytidylate kinase [Lachnospiraceae bacterium oral taxon 500]
MKAIRGAITVKENTAAEILGQTEKLLTEIMVRNLLTEEEIVAVFFSATKDLTAAYPAGAARNLGLTQTALACYTEMEVEGSLRRCIRVLLLAEMKRRPYHVYLEEAKDLRPDWGNQTMKIAIDGPSGAGKSTIARELAGRLGIVYVDTGAMYRAVGLLSLRRGLVLEKDSDVEAYRQELTELAENAPIILKYEDGVQRLYLQDEDVSEQLRTQEVGERASKISTIREVRQAMVRLQQQIADSQSVVMDGRDIGTVVLPEAEHKIFLTASAEVRGQRRCRELQEKGQTAELETIIAEIKERDERDRNRQESPLRKAADAFEIDTSDKSIDEVVTLIWERIKA